MKVVKLLLFINLLSVSYVSASVIKGKCLGTDNQPLPYFIVAILSPSDSSMVFGGAFIDGDFKFNDIKKGNYLVQIRCLGYHSVTFHTEVTQDKDMEIDLGAIKMEFIEIEEVVVTAKYPVFKRKEGKLFVIVKNTYLSEAGNLLDALKISPGLIVDHDNNILVPGKGAPIIYINNKEVQNKAEIEALQSEDIESIEIDRNPSAKYSASGKAIVQIFTRKINKEQTHLQIFNRSTFARKFSNDIV